MVSSLQLLSNTVAVLHGSAFKFHWLWLWFLKPLRWGIRHVRTILDPLDFMTKGVVGQNVSMSNWVMLELSKEFFRNHIAFFVSTELLRPKICQRK
jgi:hypothetical protein